MQSAVRNQVELRACDLDSALPAEHQARAVWAFVQSLDLQALYAQIRAVEGRVGGAPIDPAILMSLWLYATLELSDFRVEHPQWLDGQLTRSVAGVCCRKGWSA